MWAWVASTSWKMLAFRVFQYSHKKRQRAANDNLDLDFHCSKFSTKEGSSHHQTPPSCWHRAWPIRLEKEHLPNICSVDSSATQKKMHLPRPVKPQCWRASQVRILLFMVSHMKYFIFLAILIRHKVVCHHLMSSSSTYFKELLYARWAFIAPVYRLAFQIIWSGELFKRMPVSLRKLI